MLIRPATLADADVIVAYNVALADETEDVALDPDVVARGVRRAIESDRGATYWLAEIDCRVVGQLMTTREWSDWRDGWYVWLQSVYVDAAYRGRGVFRTLLEHVTKTSTADPDIWSVRLYVEHDNAAAQQTYQRLGFRDADYDVYERVVS